MQNKHIILIKPYFEDFYQSEHRNFPYGLFTLASILIKKKFEVTLLDCSVLEKRKTRLPSSYTYLEKYYLKNNSYFSIFSDYYRFGYSDEKITDLLGRIIEKKGEPLLIGISSFATAYTPYAFNVALLVKQLYGGPLFAGGIGFYSLKKEDSPLVDLFDIIFQGDADNSLPAVAKLVGRYKNPVSRWDEKTVRCLFQNIKFRKTMETIPGLYSIKHNLDTGVNFVENIGSIETGDIFRKYLMDLEEYSEKKKSSITDIYSHFSFSATRGCPYRCKYCYISIMNSPYRKKDTDSVINELKIAYHSGFRKINFDDDSLFADKKYCFSLLHKIIDLNYKDLTIYFYNGLNFHHLDRETVILLKKANVKYLSLSMGSFSEQIQAKVNRPAKHQNYKNIFLSLAREDFITEIFLILPLSGQSVKEILNSFFYLFSTGNTLGFSIFYPVKGGALNTGWETQNLESYRSSFLSFVHGKIKREEVIVFFYWYRVFSFIRKETEKVVYDFLKQKTDSKHFFELGDYKQEFKSYLRNYFAEKFDLFFESGKEEPFCEQKDNCEKHLFFNRKLSRLELTYLNLYWTFYYGKIVRIEQNKSGNRYEISIYNYGFQDELSVRFVDYFMSIDSTILAVSVKKAQDKDKIKKAVFLLHENTDKKKSIPKSCLITEEEGKQYSEQILYTGKFAELFYPEKKGVSVIIPVYERERQLTDTFFHLLLQTYFSSSNFFEILIIDDGSRSLNFEEMLETIKRNFKDESHMSRYWNSWELPQVIKKRILSRYSKILCSHSLQEYLDRVFSNIKIIKLDENKGASVARNAGIEMAGFEIVFFLDSDDLWLPEKLEAHCYEYLKNPFTHGVINDDLWAYQKKWRNKTEKYMLKSMDKIKKMSKDNSIVSLSCFSCLKSSLTQYKKKYKNIFNPQLKYLEDFDFFSKYFEESPVVFVPEILGIKGGGRDDQLSFVYRKEIHNKLNDIKKSL